MSGREARGGRSALADERGLTLVEVVVALLVLSVGLLAVAGMTLSVGTQVRRAGLYTDQNLVAQERLDRAAARGWNGTSTGTTVDTVVRNGVEWEVTEIVSDLSARLRQVEVTVGGNATVPDRTFTLRLARPRPLPN